MNQSPTELPSIEQAKPNRRRLELGLAALFVTVNLLAPLAVGELYPFTISPMFCDQPQCYCVYEVLKPDGQPVEDLSQFGLHLVYDGNPPGLGMGVVPPATLHDFGQVPQRQDIVDHVQSVLRNRSPAIQYVTVKQKVVSHRDFKICESENVWRIDAETEQ